MNDTDRFHHRAPPPADLPGWRREERSRLRAARDALSVAGRTHLAERLSEHLTEMIVRHGEDVTGRVISGYWPIKGEPDLRGWLTAMHRQGAQIALPVVETRAAPLVFRRWTPETKMIRGDWNIPVPPPDSAPMTPGIMLAPLVGWDGAGYRLGYGGGYFDRTLAALAARPLTIGIGLQAAELPTIHPQPHDIPLDLIVTEDGVQADRRIPA